MRISCVKGEEICTPSVVNVKDEVKPESAPKGKLPNNREVQVITDPSLYIKSKIISKHQKAVFYYRLFEVTAWIGFYMFLTTEIDIHSDEDEKYPTVEKILDMSRVVVFSAAIPVIFKLFSSHYQKTANLLNELLNENQVEKD